MRTLDEAAVTFLGGRRVAALATVNADGRIHQTAVWYLFKDGLLFVTTSSRSRQFRNVEARPTASLMIDTRVPGFEYGLAASGDATGIRGDEAHQLSRQIHERYLTPRALRDPMVGPSFASDDDVVIRLSPRSWVSWDMGRLNAEVFDQKLGTSSGYMFALDET